MEACGKEDRRKQRSPSKWSLLKNVMAAIRAMQSRQKLRKKFQILEMEPIVGDEESFGENHEVFDWRTFKTHASEEDGMKQRARSKWTLLKNVMAAIRAMQSRQKFRKKFQILEMESIVGGEESFGEDYQVFDWGAFKTHASEEDGRKQRARSKWTLLKNVMAAVRAMQPWRNSQKNFQNLEKGSFVGRKESSDMDYDVLHWRRSKRPKGKLTVDNFFLPSVELSSPMKFSIMNDKPLFYALSPEMEFSILNDELLDLDLSPEMESSALSFSVSRSAATSSEVTTCYEGKEQIRPKKKKTKISTEHEDSMYNLERSKHPIDRTHLERCIEHCSLFLPDCEFEKDKLVQMWIAEECIGLEVTERMEDIGNLYFDALVDEEVIIPSSFDNLYRRMKYKVNTSKAPTWLLKRGDYVRIDAGKCDEIGGVVLHLALQYKTLDRTSVDALKNFKQLRTLVFEDCSALIKQLPNNIFSGLKLLKTLDLSRTHISELPGSIGLLESLRYFDISETPVKQLPESIDRLYFLQTLKLKGCFGLLALPRGLGRLINLRHLDLDIVSQLKSMPRGMGNLIKLQTLQAFLVGKNDRCGIEELKNLNEITGSLCISMLENVSSAEEAKEAALGDKKYIDKLELRWRDHVNDNSQDTAEILECLQPHFQLGELQLTFYSGSKLPSWISNPSFTDLASITLYKCINCNILPSLGELPSLKILHIVDMNNVKNINALFFRNHGTQGSNAFPMLEKLTLDNMSNLEEWTGIEDGDFPCLHHVSIRYCPKLCVLPCLSNLCFLQHLEISHCMQMISLPEGLLPGSLESLIIRGCPKINERCLKDGGEDRFKIASVKDIWIDFEKICLD